jgi:hypothetical protein
MLRLASEGAAEGLAPLNIAARALCRNASVQVELVVTLWADMPSCGGRPSRYWENAQVTVLVLVRCKGREEGKTERAHRIGQSFSSSGAGGDTHKGGTAQPSIARYH